MSFLGTTDHGWELVPTANKARQALEILLRILGADEGLGTFRKVPKKKKKASGHTERKREPGWFSL